MASLTCETRNRQRGPRRCTSLLPIRLLVPAAVLSALVAFAGCGGSSTSSATTSQSPRASIQLAANPSGRLTYNTKSVTTATGKLTIDFTNHSELPHNLTTARSDGTVLGATPTFRGGTRTLSLDLAPGTYSFYCTVPGHRSAGMQGTLIVK